MRIIIASLMLSLLTACGKPLPPEALSSMSGACEKAGMVPSYYDDGATVRFNCVPIKENR